MSSLPDDPASGLAAAPEPTAPPPVPPRPTPLPAEPPRPDTPAVSAFDRVQTRTESRIPLTPDASRGAYWRTVSRVAVVLALVGAVVYFARRDPGTDSDLLARLAEIGDDYQPALVTTDRAQAAQYVERTSGWAIDVPELPGMALVGVGFADLSPQTSVPAFRYEGDGRDDAVVFAYDYVFLDEIRGSYTLAEAVYASLADEPPLDTRRLGGTRFVSWRRRAVLYTAVTTSDDVFERVSAAMAE